MAVKEQKIIIDYNIPAFDYLDYLMEAVEENKPFKYQEVNQITSRYAGKTVAGTIALIKTIITAWRVKKSIVIYVLRMRYKDFGKAWKEILNWLNKFQIPYYTKKGDGEISVLGSKIYVKGCYTTNSNQIAFIGETGLTMFSHGIIVFEEAFEFDEKTESAILEAIRGLKFRTIIYRTNPWFSNNWYIKRCFTSVSLNEEYLLNDENDGNIFQEKEDKVYHYARWTINPNLEASELRYLEDIKKNNPQRAKTVYYGLPGAYEGMVFADIMHKVNSNFVMKKWTSFTAGIDVGHVSSAMTAGLWAMEPFALYKIGEYYHSNKTSRYKESVELAQDILTFYSEQKEIFKFQNLNCFVDSADRGFISLLNTEARKLGKTWFLARACSKIDISHRISFCIYAINKEIINIHSSCKNTWTEWKMLAYDEKAEDDKVKLVKQNDHTFDSDMYALTPFMKKYISFSSL